MAYITGEYKYPKKDDITIEVLQPVEDELDYEDGLYIQINLDLMAEFKPEELRDLAKWISDMANHIEESYNKDGSKK